MNVSYFSDALAAALSVAIVFAYHALLRQRVRRDPGYTIQAVLNQGRIAWVERMMAENQGILAVQTLRNAIMGASFCWSASASRRRAADGIVRSCAACSCTRPTSCGCRSRAARSGAGFLRSGKGPPP